ncbi:SRPBCC family protein [Streptomyces sp. cmx-4-9]|uniref:SRPBCC family protein n=1 Tax=Streptomyces sp. cmx-4-9 TaxID=2790941 RepID=UPI00397FBCDE
MPVIRIVHTTEWGPAAAWSRLTDWERHGAQVPLTRTIVTTPPPNGVGTSFTARTGVGGLGFDDPMDVVVWRPPAADAPGLVRLEKRGRIVTGWAEIGVRARPGGGSEVRWDESLRLRALPRLLDPLVAAAGRRMFSRALHRLLQP